MDEIEVSGEEKSGTARELDPPEGRVVHLVKLSDAVRSAVQGKGANRSKLLPSEEDGKT